MFKKYKNQLVSLTRRAQHGFANATAVTALTLASPFAFAAGESTSIIAAFSEWKVEIILVLIAFAVVLWAKRGGKLMNP